MAIKISGTTVIDDSRNFINGVNLNLTGIATAVSFSGGGVEISSGIVTATSGVVTYYGDGSNLIGVSADGWFSISTETSNQAQYIPYATSFGSTTGLGATTLLVYNPSIASLGIGTTNPQANLHVVGDILVSGAVTTTDLFVKAPDNTDIFSVTGIGSTATDTIFEVTDFNDGTLLSATTDSNLLLSPTGAGYVGIGTTNPQQPFDVHVESRFQNGIRIGAANSTSYYKMEYNTSSQTLDISFFAS